MPWKIYFRTKRFFRGRSFRTNAQRAAWAAAAFCFVTVDLARAAPNTLKFGYILSSNSQLGRGEKVFAREVARLTNGRYKVENYPDAMLGGEVAMMKDVQLGALDLAFVTGAPLPNFVPAAGVFNIPFLFHDAATARMVLEGPIGDEYLKKFDAVGMVALAWGENGMRQLTNSKRPIRTPDDLKGLKIRLPQSDVMAAGFKALGATVEQIPFPQVYSALRGGVVDGEENPVATILASRFYEVQSYLSLTSHVYDPAVILMSEDAYAALPDGDKRAFRTAARMAATESRVAAAEAQRDGVAILKAEGMSIEPDIDTVPFARAVKQATPTFDRMFGHDAIVRIESAAEAADRRVAAGGRG